MPRIVQLDVDRRPKLVALVREGDPQAALALVLGGLTTTDESIRLAALLATRLTDPRQRFEVLPRLGGASVVASFDNAFLARQLTSKLDHALRARIRSEELTSPEYQASLRQMRRVVAFQVSAAERALCLAEPPAGDQSTMDVEQVRQRAFGEGQARWGVVGAQDLVAAVDDAVRNLEPWPRIEVKTNATPDQDRGTFLRSGNPSPHLDVAWWSPVVQKGFGAKRDLLGGPSALSDVLSTLPAALRLDRVTVSPQPQGSCVALSLSPGSPDGSVPTEELVAAAHAAIEALRRLARQPANEASTTLAVVDETDPRTAAELAARLSLSADAKTEVDRFAVALDVGSASVMPTPAQQHAVLVPTLAMGSIPTTSTVERGQGNLYALLASPCAAWRESSRTVGATSLLLRTLASSYHPTRNVVIEPWITADGAGLIAHAPRLSMQESPEEQARRLGEVLGQVFTTHRIRATDLWQARTDLLARIGPGQRPALWSALLSLSPQAPALVLPDGQFSSIEAISLETLLERRAELLRLPLRLAVLENHDARQRDALRSALAEWVSPYRLEPSRCPELGRAESVRSGQIRIESREPDPNDAGTTLAMSLPSQEPLAETHAVLVQWLLGRASGWLALRLRSEGIVASVDAKVVGGARTRGLVIAIAAPPTAMDPAAAAVRAVLQELGTGAVPAAPSIASAIVEVQAAERNRRIDPKARLEDLWLSRGRLGVVSEASLRDYLRKVFSAPNLLEVRSTRAGVDPSVGGRQKR